MLSVKSMELLTAFVDGELSAHERKLAARLMEMSAEARQLVKELQENAHRLRQLPSRRLEPEFADGVVRIIKDRHAHPGNNTPKHSTPATVPIIARRSSWRRYAAAAAILVMAAGGVYLATRPGDPLDNGVIAEQKQKAAPNRFEPTIAELIEGTVREFGKPVPAARAGARFEFAQLKDKQQIVELTKQLQTTKTVHLDLTVRDRREAVRKLDQAFRGQGIKLVVDRAAQAALKEADQAEYVLYAENITAGELTALLSELSGAPAFETMIVSNVTNDDQQQVAQLMGIEQQELLTPRGPGEALPKFVAKEDKKGAPQQPSVANTQQQPRPGPAPRLALMMANETGAGGGVSSELRYFLQQRRQLRPDALQIIVVLHQA